MESDHGLPWEILDIDPGMATIPDFYLGIDTKEKKPTEGHLFSRPVYTPEKPPVRRVTPKLSPPQKCQTKKRKRKRKHAVSKTPTTPQTLKTPKTPRTGESRGHSESETSDDGEEEDSSGSDSEFDLEDMVPSSTKAVLTNIETSLEDRRKTEIREKLDRIIDRIEITLLHAGDESGIPRDPEKAAEMLSAIERGKEFSIQAEKDEINRKQKLLSHMDLYKESLMDRQTIVQHISDWLESCGDVEKGCLTDAEWEERETRFREINDEIQNAFGCANEATDKIREIGYRLLKDAGYIDEDDDEGSRRRKKMRPFEMEDVLEEEDLEKPQNLDKAMLEVKLIMDQAIRFVRIQQHKNVMRAGIKQFKHLSKNVTKRVMDMKQFEEAISGYKEKVSELETVTEDLEGKVKSTTEKLEQTENVVHTQAQRVRELTAENSELQSIIAELEVYKEQVISSGQDNISTPGTSSTQVPSHRSSGGLSKKTATPPGSSVHSHSSVMSVKQEIQMTASMLQQATRPLQAEISKLKAEVQEKGGQIEVLEKTLGFAHQEIDQLNVKIGLMNEMTGDSDSLAKMLKDETSFTLKTLRDEKDSLEKQVAMMGAELTCKNELIGFQEKRLKEMKDEVGAIDLSDITSMAPIKTKDGSPVSEEVKSLMFHMKKDLESEIDRLRKHMDREKARQEATIRKLEKKHKDDLLNIHKQSLHLLRAINRFKDSVANILERESLPIAAADVKRFPKLQTEENNQSDAKLLLAQMAGSAVELLVNMEFKLSQALMNKRLEVKDNSIAKNFAAKDLETQMEAAQKAKKAAEAMAETMKELKRKLVTAEEAIIEMRKMEDERFSGLSERYRKLMYQYTNLQKEFTKLTLESKKAMKEKDRTLNKVVSHRNSMVQMVEEQQGMMSNMARHISKKRDLHNMDIQLSVKDQKQNLDTLEKALKENKISKQMYTMTVDLIKQSMDLPILKLRNLCEKYIAFRRMQDVKKVLLESMDDSLLEERKASMEEYMRKREHRLEEDNKAWNEERKSMDEKRTFMFQDMASLFSEMIVEQGVLLIVPEDKLLKVPSVVHSPSGETFTSSLSSSDDKSAKKSRRKLRKNSIFRKSPIEDMPSELVGTSVASMKKGGTSTTAPPLLWNVNAPHVLPPIKQYEINTPRMMEFDIQQQLRAAQKALAGLRYRTALPMAHASGYDYSLDKVTPLCNLSDRGFGGDSEEGSTNYDASTVASDAQDSGIDCIDNTMVNIRVDIKVKDHHYTAGTNMKRKKFR